MIIVNRSESGSTSAVPGVFLEAYENFIRLKTKMAPLGIIVSSTFDCEHCCKDDLASVRKHKVDPVEPAPP